MIRHTRSHTSMVALLAILAALLAPAAAPAGAETFGGLGQVGSLVAEAPGSGGVNGQIALGSGHGFVVNPQTGAYYLAHRYETGGKPGFMVQAFSPAGAFVASEKVAGGNADQIGGLAFSPATERVYLLLLRKRPPENEEAKKNQEKDEGKLKEEEATLKTEEEHGETAAAEKTKEKIKELETAIAAERAKVEISDPNRQAAAVVYSFPAGTLKTPSIVADEKGLEPLAEGETPLLDAHGIAAEPAGAHDLLLLGQQDVSASKATTELRAAVQRVHVEGEPVGPRYIDNEDCLDDGHSSIPGCSEAKEEPSSPIVLPNHTLLAERGQALWGVPSITEASKAWSTASAAKRFTAKPELAFRLPGNGGVVSLEAGKPEAGDQVALAPSGAGAGRIYIAAHAAGGPAIVVLTYHEAGEPTYTELGWSGGGGAPACTVPGGPTDVLTGGTETDGFLFGAEPLHVAVMRFGQSAEACAHVSLAPLTASVEGKEAMNVLAGEEVTVPSLKEVTFKSSISGANALSGEWTFQNLDRRAETPQTIGFQEGAIETQKKFAEAETGRYLVTLEAHPDDFEPTQVRQLYVVVGMRVAFKSLRGANVGQAVPFHVKVVDPYEPGPPEFTYKWRFGDGTTLETKSASTEPAFEHVYSKAGTYEPFLEVVDRGEHRAAAISTGVIVTAAGSPPPPGGSSGSKPAPTLKPTFSTRLSSASIVVRNGKVRLKLSCTATTGSCKGRIVLKTVRAFRAGRHAKKRVLTLAHTTFDIPAGRVTTVVLQLTRKGRSLLGRKHSLQATALVSTEQSSGQPISTATALTLRLARRH